MPDIAGQKRVRSLSPAPELTFCASLPRDIRLPKRGDLDRSHPGDLPQGVRLVGRVNALRSSASRNRVGPSDWHQGARRPVGAAARFGAFNVLNGSIDITGGFANDGVIYGLITRSGGVTTIGAAVRNDFNGAGKSGMFWRNTNDNAQRRQHRFQMQWPRRIPGFVAELEPADLKRPDETAKPRMSVLRASPFPVSDLVHAGGRNSDYAELALNRQRPRSCTVRRQRRAKSNPGAEAGIYVSALVATANIPATPIP